MRIMDYLRLQNKEIMKTKCIEINFFTFLYLKYIPRDECDSNTAAKADG